MAVEVMRIDVQKIMPYLEFNIGYILELLNWEPVKACVGQLKSTFSLWRKDENCYFLFISGWFSVHLVSCSIIRPKILKLRRQFTDLIRLIFYKPPDLPVHRWQVLFRERVQGRAGMWCKYSEDVLPCHLLLACWRYNWLICRPSCNTFQVDPFSSSTWTTLNSEIRLPLTNFSTVYTI